ncbi:MAG: hypothetical protein ABIZ18_09985 [Caldimonas sp.]
MNNDLNKPGTPNRDPLTGAPGAHPVGTGVGAAVGGVAAGAAVGSVAGPVGTVVGAAVGAVVGGLAGKGVAESVDPTAEDAYWRENYAKRPYVQAGTTYEQYRPAYGYAASAYGAHAGKSFDQVEDTLGRDWDRAKGSSTLTWEHAKAATRDAWDRMLGRRA